MTMTAITVDHLSKVYHLYDSPQARLKEALHPLRRKYHHDFYALNDVSFSVEQGEVLGIIGKNGCGKSTLLKILAGVLTPTSGAVAVNGNVSALLELGGGFNPEFTGLENVYFSSAIMGYTRDQVEKNLDNILAFADIGEFIHQPVKTYSSGMYVRLAFAVAINVDPDVLIVDEALAVGDIRFQQKCFRKIREFQEHGKSIIFVTHDTGAVINFCNQAIWLDSGKIKYEGAPDEAAKRYVAYMTYDSETEERESSERIELPTLPEPSNQIVFSIDTLSVGEKFIDISGWGFMQDESAEQSETYLVFASRTNTFLFTTQRVKRQDVTEAHKMLHMNLDDSGFSALIPRDKIEPPDEYNVGLYLKKETIEALRYTEKVVHLTNETLQTTSQNFDAIEWQDVSSCASFGEGGAKIVGVALYEKKSWKKIRSFKGGEDLIFYVKAEIEQEICLPIYGFIIKDHYGNTLVGINSYIYKKSIPSLLGDQIIVVRFDFKLPNLKNDHYLISTSIADGTQENHVQLHWIHDCCDFSVNNIDWRYKIGCYIVVDEADVNVQIL